MADAKPLSWGDRFRLKMWEIREKLILRKGYDPERYWEERGKIFHLEPVQHSIGWEHEELLDTLKKTSWTSLVELGCGFGRNLNFLSDHFSGRGKAFTGIDISQNLLNRCRKNLHNKDILLLVMSVLNLSGLSTHPDVILTHGLLMHLPPGQIDRAVLEMAKILPKNVLVIEQIIPGLKKEAPSAMINQFTFHHPYLPLFSSRGFSLKNQKIVGPLGFFHFVK